MLAENHRNLHKVFPGDSKMAELMRKHDWSATSLGSVSEWPQCLRAAVAICLGTKSPVSLKWGNEHSLLYNDAFSKLLKEKHPAALGCPAQEVLREHWTLIGPRVNHVLETGKADESNLPIFFPASDSGGETTYDFTYNPIPGDDGSAMGVFSIVTENTETRKFQELLKESEERLKIAQEAADIGLWDLDLANHSAWRSLKHDQIFGYDKLLPKWNYEIFLKHVHPEDKPSVKKKFEISQRFKTDWEFEARIVRADKTERWIWARGRIKELDDNNQPLRMSGVVIDITKRKQSEFRLRESEERYRMLFESMEEGYSILQVEFDNLNEPIDYRFLNYNPTFEKITGLKEVHNQSMRTLLPDLEEAWYKKFGEVALSGKSSRFELAAKPLGRYYEVHAYPFGDKGSGRVAVLFSDITERKEAENTQRLLLGELDHRVKNTMATVQAIANQTLRQTPDPQEFVEKFNGRIYSLSRAHSLLTKSKWRGASLSKILTEQLGLQNVTDRVTYSGPEVSLSAKASQHLALVLHELGTNALKYGSLSSAKGRVIVIWDVNQTANGPVLTIEWTEHNGPTVEPPPQPGFGMNLIQKSLNSVDGSTMLHFEPQGLRCEISLLLPTDKIPYAHNE